MWEVGFEKLKEFINKYKRRPKNLDINNSNKDLNEEFENLNNEKYLGSWVTKQNSLLTNNINNDRAIRWKEYVEQNKEIFITNDEIWLESLEKVKKYINLNKCRPPIREKLGKWISHQIDDTKNKTRAVYNNKEFKKLWEEFYKEYEKYFISNEDIWYENYNKLINFINENNKRPKKITIDEEESFLNKWIDTQNNINYKNKDKNRIMNSNKEICKTWEKFLVEYAGFFREKKN